MAPERTGFTLVEMLIAMAITLVMMAAVATLFANVSTSVRNRRATIEMTNQMRHLRNVLQQDLQGATCPGITWQRPESNHGYIEIIEGIYRDSYPSILTDGIETTAPLPNPELNPALSIIPRNNGAPDTNGNGRIDANEWEAHYQSRDSLRISSGAGYTGVSGLGDYDDILMLTTRNEHEPFVARMPTIAFNGSNVRPFPDWTEATLQSALAEVVWFAIENPDTDNNADGFFGEPGMRTIYRRTLLIAPWVNPYRRITNPTTGAFNDSFSYDGDNFQAEPGLVRILPKDVEFDDVAEALAALVAFQDRYDLSVRLEWDANIGGGDGRWKIIANTLGDLTKRENRFGHYGFQLGSGSKPSTRVFPYASISWGRGYSPPKESVLFVQDPERNSTPGTPAAKVDANIQDGAVVSFTVAPVSYQDPNNKYSVRPFAYVDATPNNGMPCTANAILNDDGQVVRVVFGPVPLCGTRRGEDVMMTDALAFDVRVYDPGAPLFGVRENLANPTSAVGWILEPSDPGWKEAYQFDPDNRNGNVSRIGANDRRYPLTGQGAYVDLGYQFDMRIPKLPDQHLHMPPVFANSTAASPWFFAPRALSDVFGNQLAPGYTVYDTWSYHYENNGRDDDNRDGDDDLLTGVDEWIDGIDQPDWRTAAPFDALTVADFPVGGPDDIGERETVPPYDKPLRGAQVIVRAYERDSRAIRQIRVSQHFMSE